MARLLSIAPTKTSLNSEGAGMTVPPPVEDRAGAASDFARRFEREDLFERHYQTSHKKSSI
jgi:hypothetical protein